MGKIGYSIQGLVAKVKDAVYYNKWLIWLVCGEPLIHTCTRNLNIAISKIISCANTCIVKWALSTNSIGIHIK